MTGPLYNYRSGEGSREISDDGEISINSDVRSESEKSEKIRNRKPTGKRIELSTQYRESL